jgi:hypothetical protein
MALVQKFDYPQNRNNTMKFPIIPIALIINLFFISLAQADTILGIHAHKWHAWLSVTVDGTTNTYGLWPDDKAWYNDKGHDIRKNFYKDALSNVAASRYYRLTLRQIQTLNWQLNQNLTWGYIRNCAWWASRVVRKVVGEDVDANHDFFLGIPDSEELCDNIKYLEEYKNDTSHLRPSGVARRHKYCSSGSSSSSSSSSW